MKKNLLTALFSASMLALAGCSASAASTSSAASSASEKKTITVTDYYGEVEVPVNPETVVSLDNRTFETLSDWGIELAAAPKDVMPADSPYVDDENVQNIGNHREPDLEIIAAVQPDLVIVGQRFASYYDEIRSLVPDAAVLDLDVDVSESAENAGDNLINGLKNSTTVLGQIFGKEEEARALCDEFVTAVKEAGEAYPEGKTIMSVNVSGGETGYIAPHFGRIFGPWYDVFGWTPALEITNATTDHQGDEVSVEAIADSNPDYMMILDRDAAISAGSAPAKEVIESSPALQNVTAVKEGSLIYAPNDTYVNESIQTYIEYLNSVTEAFSK